MATNNLTQELIRLSQKYVREVLSQKYAAIWDKTCVYLYGSVSYGEADESSNANLQVISSDEELNRNQPFFVQYEGRQIMVMFGYSWSQAEKYLIGLPVDDEAGLYGIHQAIVLHDPAGRFKKIQEKVNHYYPDKTWKDKLFKKWLSYFYARSGLKNSLIRNESIVVQIYKGKLLQEIMELTFILNRQYFPFAKWLHRKFLGLPLLSKEIEPHLHRIVEENKVDDLLNEIDTVRYVFYRLC